MDDDPVADLARLDLADVRFQERVRGHVASITGTSFREHEPSGSLVQQRLNVMDLRQLATFRAIVETGNFARAADRLGIAAPP
jgi:Bacterial regulatory helix-turn-helix protein, lysR family